jgi:hypothetical protein
MYSIFLVAQTIGWKAYPNLDFTNYSTALADIVTQTLLDL